MKVVQLFTRERATSRDFDAMNADHRDAWFMSIRYDAALFAVVELASGITIAIVIWQATGLADAGTLYVFFDWMRRFFLPLRDLSAKYSVMQSSMASAERIFQLLDTQPAVVDRAPPKVAPLRARRRARAATVEFDHVWFAYQGEDWVLRDVTFRVAPGERVAIVGATGGRQDHASSSCSRGSTSPTRGRDPARRRRPARAAPGRAAPARGDGAPGRLPVQRQRSRRTSRSTAPERGPRERRARGAAPCSADRFIARSRRATTPRCASAAATSRPASASCSPSRARSPTAATCWCSTRPPARSTPRPRRWSRRASTC